MNLDTSASILVSCDTNRLFTQFAGQPGDVSGYCRQPQAIRGVLGSFAGNMAQLAEGETLQCEQELIAIVHTHLFTQSDCGASYVVIPRARFARVLIVIDDIVTRSKISSRSGVQTGAAQFLKFPNPIII